MGVAFYKALKYGLGPVRKSKKLEIEILGAESLGVRGLCCFIGCGDRNVLIDPGIALGYKRHRLLPHPFQVAVDERIQRKILDRWQSATDIVISHFHGDHVPLADANPFQLNIRQVLGLNPDVRMWVKAPDAYTPIERERAADLALMLKTDLLAETGRHEAMTFSRPVPHGDYNSSDTVMMTRIESERVFVHASDIQLLNEEAVLQILDWRPDVALVGGPPLYLSRLSENQIRNAWRNALRLARGVDCLILDHHLMRNFEGEAWLEKLSRQSGSRVMCSADFMNTPRMLLEASRQKLYRDMPVSPSWHESYGMGTADTDAYWHKAGKLYPDLALL